MFAIVGGRRGGHTLCLVCRHPLRWHAVQGYDRNLPTRCHIDECRCGAFRSPEGAE